MSRFRRHLLIVLGLLGIITPVLPTTVFFIMAAGLFVHASPRLHRRINQSRLTGPFLRAYTEGKGLSRRRKASTIALLWITLAVSAWFVHETWWLLVILASVGVGVTIHVATIRPRNVVITVDTDKLISDESARE